MNQHDHDSLRKRCRTLERQLESALAATKAHARDHQTILSQYQQQVDDLRKSLAASQLRQAKLEEICDDLLNTLEQAAGEEPPGWPAWWRPNGSA